MKEIYDKEHDVIRKFLSMGRRNIEMLEEIALEYKPFLMGKRFMTDAQLSERLGISRRTLQDFRDRGIIPFYRLDGKILYEERDIAEYLSSIYIPKY